MEVNAKEMVRRIYEDIQDALTVIAGHLENPPAIIESVNARVGERSAAIRSMEDLNPSPFSSQNGWILDITFSPLQPSPDARTFKTISTFPLFRALSVKTLKGVGSVWAGRFRENRLGTIGELVAADDSTINALVNRFNTLHPMMCRHMAAQLDRKIPLDVIEKFGHQDLNTLIRTDPKNLAAACPEAAMGRLTAQFLSSCTAGLERPALSSLRLISLLS